MEDCDSEVKAFVVYSVYLKLDWPRMLYGRCRMIVNN